MSEIKHKNRCDNQCLRRMDTVEVGKGQFRYSKGTMDCPARVSEDEQEIIEAMSVCGCCSYDNGSTVKKPEDCQYRKGNGDISSCGCHNTMVIYATCLSKRNHGACPYGLKR